MNKNKKSKAIVSQTIDYLNLASLFSLNIIIPFIIISSAASSKDVEQTDTKITPPQNVHLLDFDTMSTDKTLIWFCVGAFGYAAIYAIGKNISNK